MEKVIGKISVLCKVYAAVKSENKGYGRDAYCCGKYSGCGSGHGCPQESKGNDTENGNDCDDRKDIGGQFFHGVYLLKYFNVFC